MILTYQQFLLDELRARGVQPAAEYPIPWGSLWLAGSGARTIAVAGGFGIGAPAATTVLEQFIALGAREFISIGASIRLLDGALHALGGPELRVRPDAIPDAPQG